MATFVALLRGINVGGRTIKMDALRDALASLKLTNIQTVLASGNVVFETTQTNQRHLQTIIEEKLAETFSFKIRVIIRPMNEIHRLVESDPFADINVTPKTRLYVTFLSDDPTSKLKIPYTDPNEDFTILSVSDHEVCSVLHLSATQKTTDCMKTLEKEFGKDITTRNWNTVLKIAKLGV